MSSELSSVVKDLLDYVRDTGQIPRASKFLLLGIYLNELANYLGIKINVNKEFLDLYIWLSKSEPSYADTHGLKVIEKIAEGIVHQTQIVEEALRQIPIVHLSEKNKKNKKK